MCVRQASVSADLFPFPTCLLLGFVGWFGGFVVCWFKAVSHFIVVVHRSKMILSAIEHLAWDTKA